MSARSARFDRRGLSEVVALVVLVGMAVATVAAAGAYTLVADESATEDTKFAFEHYADSRAALITYQAGPERRAGEVVIEGPEAAASWATLANAAPDEPVGVGDAVQISNGNAYNASVESGDTIRIYDAGDGNRTELASWTAG